MTTFVQDQTSFAQIRSIAWVHMSIQVLESAGVIKLFPRHDDHVEARGGCERTSKAVNSVIAVRRLGSRAMRYV